MKKQTKKKYKLKDKKTFKKIRGGGGKKTVTTTHTNNNNNRHNNGNNNGNNNSKFSGKKFIETLLSVKDLIHALLQTIPPPSSENIDEIDSYSSIFSTRIQERFNLTLHLKSKSDSTYPSVSEHYTNLELILAIFNDKYKVKKEGYAELEEYEKKYRKPAGCLDFSIDWFRKFLIGDEISQFRRIIDGQDEHEQQIILRENETLLARIISNIVETMCNQKYKHKKKYFEEMNKQRLLFNTLANFTVEQAIRQQIIDHEFVYRVINDTYMGFQAYSNENTEVLDCDGEYDKLPDILYSDFQPITTLPVRFLPKYTQIYANNKQDLLTTALIDLHYSFFVNHIKLDTSMYIKQPELV